jgi:hypothetical protein
MQSSACLGRCGFCPFRVEGSFFFVLSLPCCCFTTVPQCLYVLGWRSGLVRRLLCLFSLSRGSWQRHLVRRTASSLARCRHRHMSPKRTGRNALCRGRRNSDSVEQLALFRQQLHATVKGLFHVKRNRDLNRCRPASAVGADRDLSNLASRP